MRKWLLAVNYGLLASDDLKNRLFLKNFKPKISNFKSLLYLCSPFWG